MTIEDPQLRKIKHSMLNLNSAFQVLNLVLKKDLVENAEFVESFNDFKDQLEETKNSILQHLTEIDKTYNK